jgi:hypothetical protein
MIKTQEPLLQKVLELKQIAFMALTSFVLDSRFGVVL